MVDLLLTKIAETATTITLGWTPIPCLGYALYADGVRKSNSWDPLKSSWKTNKAAEIRVVALGAQATGVYPPAVVVPPPSGKIVAGNGPALQAACDAAVNGDVLLVQPGTISGQIHIWNANTRNFQIRGLEPANPPVFVGGYGIGYYCLYSQSPITVGPDLKFSSADGYGVCFRAHSATGNINGGRITGCNFYRGAITGIYQGTQGATHYNFLVDNCTFIDNGQREDIDPHGAGRGDGEHSCYIGGGDTLTTGALVRDCYSSGQLHGQPFQGGGTLHDSKWLRCTAEHIRKYAGVDPSSYAGFGTFSSFGGSGGNIIDSCTVNDCDGYAYKNTSGGSLTVVNSRWRAIGLAPLYQCIDGGGNGPY